MSIIRLTSLHTYQITTLGSKPNTLYAAMLYTKGSKPTTFETSLDKYADTLKEQIGETTKGTLVLVRNAVPEPNYRGKMTLRTGEGGIRTYTSMTGQHPSDIDWNSVRELKAENEKGTRVIMPIPQDTLLPALRSLGLEDKIRYEKLH